MPSASSMNLVTELFVNLLNRIKSNPISHIFPSLWFSLFQCFMQRNPALGQKLSCDFSAQLEAFTKVLRSRFQWESQVQSQLIAVSEGGFSQGPPLASCVLPYTCIPSPASSFGGLFIWAVQRGPSQMPLSPASS